MTTIKLDPICFKGFPMATTSTGYLLPCCYCDENKNLNDPEFQKILAVSKLDEHETVEEIIFSKEWKEFEENLRNHKGPHVCTYNCGIVGEDKTTIRKDTWISPEDGTITLEISR